jgi:hypothetical protein
VKEDEMGRECSMQGGENECIYDFGGKSRTLEESEKGKEEIQKERNK